MNYPKTGGTSLAFPQDNADAILNDSLRRLDASVSRWIVVDRDLAAPPGSCADGANYLVAGSPTGLWAGQAGKLATAVGANAANGWLFTTVAVEGNQLYLQDENIEIQRNGSTWVAGATGNPTECLIIAASDESTAITAGTAKVTFRMPYAFTVSAVRASLTAAQTSGSIFTVDINEGGASILSTKITIDNTEKTSTTAATAPVISDATLADDAEMTIDVDQIGDGTAKGLKVYLIGNRT